MYFIYLLLALGCFPITGNDANTDIIPEFAVAATRQLSASPAVAAPCRAHGRSPLALRLTGITGPGYTQNFAYDPSNRLILDQRQGDQPFEKLYTYDNNGNRTSSLITSGGLSTTLDFNDNLLPVAIVPRSATWAVLNQALQADLGPLPANLEGVASVATESPTVVPSVAVGKLATQITYSASTSFAGVILRENATYRWQVGIVPQGDNAILRGVRLTKKTKVELVLSESPVFQLPSHQVTLVATRINTFNGWVISAIEPSISLLVAAPAAATTGFGLLAQTPSITTATVRFDNVSWTTGGTRASRTSTFDRWNRLRRILGSEDSTFTYDPRGRLTNKQTVTTASTTNDDYAYDALARQIGFKRTVTASTPGSTPQVKLDVGYAFYGTSTMRAGVKPATGALTTYAMDGTAMLAETTGTTLNKTRYFAGGSSPLWQKEATGEIQTYLKDGQGNVTGMVKAATDVYRFTYDAYGVTTAKNAAGNAVTAPTGPRYRGAWFDSATGQYQMGARFYTPSTGTFATEDPIRADENWYAYCGGDPVNRADPSGLDWVWTNGQWEWDNTWDGHAGVTLDQVPWTVRTPPSVAGGPLLSRLGVDFYSQAGLLDIADPAAIRQRSLDLIGAASAAGHLGIPARLPDPAGYVDPDPAWIQAGDRFLLTGSKVQVAIAAVPASVVAAPTAFASWAVGGTLTAEGIGFAFGGADALLDPNNGGALNVLDRAAGGAGFGGSGTVAYLALGRIPVIGSKAQTALAALFVGTGAVGTYDSFSEGNYAQGILRGTGTLLGGYGAYRSLRPAPVRVYRVEGAPNSRISIDENGVVAIQGQTTLFLNFGSRARAVEYFQQKILGGLPDVVTKSFLVRGSFLKTLREQAVPERLARTNPQSPLVVDITKAPDQYGLRPDQFQALLEAILQGSGRIGE